MNIVEYVIRRYNKIKGLRANWDAHWQEVADYVLPKKDDIFVKQRNVGGEKKGNVKVFDATAIHSNELLASALHGMLTNPSVQWFELSFGEPTLDEDHDVKLWLQETALRIHQVLNNSNFQTEIHEVYLDLGSFGTSILRVEEDDDMDVVFNSRPVNESYLEESSKGIVNGIFREYILNGRQIFEEFPDMELSEHDLYALKQDMDKEYDILHAVFPRRNEEIGQELGPKGMQFASYHILLNMKIMLKESGFEEFPYITPRWTKISGEVYGRSPAMKALPDIKMTNVMMQTIIRAAQKVTDPPLQVPDSGYSLPIRTVPGGTNFYRAGTKDRIEPLITGARPDLGFQILEIVQKRIRDAFFIDQLQLNEGPQMTATEVLQRTEEKLRLLGPILGRQHYELLKPLVNRVYSIMVRRGKIPPAPQAIQGKVFEVRYSSMIARAQRSSEAENINRIMNTMAPIAQFSPEVLDNLDSDKLLKYVASIFNIPQIIFRREEDIEAMRQQRQQQMEAQMQQQAQLSQSQSLKNTSEAMATGA
jgi:hypothetical protein